MLNGTEQHRVLILAVFACLGTAGCGTSASYVLVDNTNKASMTVEVDGQPMAEIPAGDFQYIQLPGGDHHFRVTLGGRQVFSCTQTVEEPRGLLEQKTYLFNPTQTARYAICTFKYGEESFASNALMSAMISIAETEKGKVDPIRKEYVETKRWVKPLSSAPFLLLKGAYYKFRQPPESLLTKNGRMETRSVLTRLTAEDHGLLRKAYAVENPTEDDLNLLAYATEQAFDSVDLLDPLR